MQRLNESLPHVWEHLNTICQENTKKEKRKKGKELACITGGEIYFCY